MTRILIGTPCYSSLEVEYVVCLLEAMRTCGKRDIRLRPIFRPGSLLHCLRNQIVAMFMAETTATHLLFIDSDMSFSGENILKLLEADKEFSAIAYRGKCESVVYNLQGNPRKVCDKTGMISVDGTGGGFMLLKKSVIEKMIAAYPNLKCNGFQSRPAELAWLNKFYYDFFAWGTGERFIISEDMTFCKRWIEIGGDVWVDADQELGHVGKKIFSGKLRDNIRNGVIIERTTLSALNSRGVR